MEYPQYLTKCIGEELRFVFAKSIEANLKDRSAVCSGRMLNDAQENFEITEVKLVFGNRLSIGFYLSAQFEKKENEIVEIRLEILPLEQYDDKFSKSIIKSGEVLKSVKVIQKADCPALYLNFNSGNSLLFTPTETDQLESSIVVSFLSDSGNNLLKAYTVKEEYNAHKD